MDKLRILLSKGRIYDNVVKLLGDIGVNVYLPERTYFPITNRSDIMFQVVKPQIASLLLAQGRADAAFSGADWAAENGLSTITLDDFNSNTDSRGEENDVKNVAVNGDNKIVEVMDLGFDKVRIVAAIPIASNFDDLCKNDVTIATEYENLSKNWLQSKRLNGKIFRTWGTSEGFVQGTPQSIAEILIDNTSTGSSLRANNLKIIDTLMESSTRFYASKSAMANKDKALLIGQLKMLFGTVLAARERVMLEMNVSEQDFEGLVEALPAMKSPTVSPLFNSNAFAIKTVVKKCDVPQLLLRLQELGAQDIVEYELRKVLL